MSSRHCATRRAIVARLATSDATVLELAAPFDMSLPAISKHLKVLERAGLISRGRDGADVDDHPGKFRVTVSFDEQSNGKTVVTMRQLHSTAEQRRRTIAFGAGELGYQTLDKLAAHLAARRR